MITATHRPLSLQWPLLGLALFAPSIESGLAGADPKPAAKVSFYHDIRPILQANCQGCHQPAKSKGGYVMTEFKRLLAGGDNEGAAIVPGDPDKSAILKMITPQDGEVRMPKGKTPLLESEVALIRGWIEQGAQDDTPADAKRHYDADHPPVYSRPPVITALDFSPDGKLLAVAGFHEVLLYEIGETAPGSASPSHVEAHGPQPPAGHAAPRSANASELPQGLSGRLIGLSERVQSLRFSPDGQWLAVAAGDPARMGEIQVWDVAKRKLSRSEPISYDTLYGVSWSLDSKVIAFGCPDNTLRAIEASSGKQVLQMGSHSDWVMSTTFSVKGDHVISGGRDMSVKLTELASQRFIDNVTSITPGALKGGVLALATHPKLDHIVAGGSDGTPKVYRIFREAERLIGDDAQLIADLFPMSGRVFSVRFSPDGKRIACGSGLDRAGELLVCSYDYAEDVPAALRQIMGKVAGSRKPEEQKQLDDYKKQGIREIARAAVSNSAIYSVAFNADGSLVAAGGSDGVVRFFNATNGSIQNEFVCVPLTKIPVANVLGAPASPPASQKRAPGAPASSPASQKRTPGAPASPPATEKRSAVASADTVKEAATPTDERPSNGLKSSLPALSPESLPEAAKVVGLELTPASTKFASPNDYAQLLVTARLDSGDTADVTRLVKYTLTPPLAEVSPRGVLRPLKNGASKVSVSLGDAVVEGRLEIAGLDKGYKADFVRDVSPVISRLGCNAGTCHGAKEGKNGFKLSLRGYDPQTDLRALTDDMASRRVNLASPDDSLMLLKAVAEVPHEGSRRLTTDSKYYQILRQWIINGANLDLQSPRVQKIEVFPQDPVVQAIGSRQQIRVVATFADGEVRDVTSEAFIESGNADVATIDSAGLLTSLRRGEAPVLARYEGNYAATTLTVMGDRKGFVWKEPPTWGKIDELVAAKWKRMKIEPSELCTDLEFIRRVYLDLTGLPPSPEDIRAFLDDSGPGGTRTSSAAASHETADAPQHAPQGQPAQSAALGDGHAPTNTPPPDTRSKRDALIDRLIGSPEFVDFWANKWADLLQCNSKFLGGEGAESFRAWIRKEVENNTPYDQFAREILTATGSTRENPAASYWKILRAPAETMENTTHLFLATRFNCNKCHDHPFERWTQDQYYHLAAYFAQVSLKEDPKSDGKKIAGNDVESAKPLYEIVGDASEGEVKHDRTGKVSPPQFPYVAKCEMKEKPTRREQLAAWITTADNRFFASSYANRLWGYLTGAGIIEPLDDIRAGNPPRNPALLEYLTHEFISTGFNPRHLMQLICKSRTYQLAIRPNEWNEDDHINYSHALARRLPAETLFDAVFRVTGSTPQIPGAKPGQRADQLADAATDVGSGLLATLGRPARQSACECERSSDIRLGSVMALLSGPTVSSAIQEPTNALAKLVQSDQDDHKLVNDVFLRVLNRPATESETDKTLALLSEVNDNNSKITNELAALEVKMAPVIADMKQKRDDAIAKAKADLATYDEMTKSLKAELERRRQSEISMRQGELKDYETLLPAQAAFWETKNNPAETKTSWSLLEPKDLSATGDNKLARQSDGAITSTGGKSPSDFVILAHSPLTNITGVMLETLPDDALPQFGPGRHADGNFVLSEIELKWSAGTNAPETTAKFADAKADFSQKDFSVRQAIDGKVEAGQNGWALSGAPSIQHHTATFKLEQPIASTNGATLRVVLLQHYGEDFLLGRFRLYITSSEDPLDFGAPESVVQAARSPAGQRKPEQAAAVLDYYRAGDSELWKRKKALVKASEPLPVDPKLTELQKTLTKAEEPIRLDPYLVQLREDAKASARQTENKRLTVVQDLTWALINSAGFLFNH